VSVPKKAKKILQFLEEGVDRRVKGEKLEKLFGSRGFYPAMATLEFGGLVTISRPVPSGCAPEDASTIQSVWRVTSLGREKIRA